VEGRSERLKVGKTMLKGVDDDFDMSDRVDGSRK
jgi:hypothetical protein